MDQISFAKATKSELTSILGWLAEDHVREFWDSSQAHKDDIVNFVEGRRTRSQYCGGNYVYWVGKISDVPFSLIMTIEESMTGEINKLKMDNIAKIGKTYSLDYMIGNVEYFGKGLASKTLSEFIIFFRRNYDSEVSRFLIDPACDNPRARHVYEKAGFRFVGDFTMQGNSFGSGKLHDLLVFDLDDS